MKVNKKMQKAVVTRKETGTAEHGKTSDMGYFLFTEGDGGRALMGGEAICEDCDTLQTVMD